MSDFAGTRGGDRTVRVEDVAREAGVSPITVSRALRTPELVKAETRQRVAEAVAKTGYVVNSIASSLRSGQSAFVSVFVASLEDPHYAAAVSGMIAIFEGSRFRLTFSQAGYAEDLSAGQIRAMLPFRPAAIVFAGIVRDEAGLDEALQDVGYWCGYVLAHEFTAVDGWELQNLLTVARLVLSSARVRQESRGVHCRSDYPERDDVNWKRYVTAPPPESSS